jgi:acyl dehydratase
MSSISNVEGRQYGPFHFSVTPDNRVAFVAAVSDDADRWVNASPPGYAAAALFLTAPAFFADGDVQSVSEGVIHADQTFTWSKPWVDGRYTATGIVDRVRERRGSFFVTLTTTVHDSIGDEVVVSVSTFLMAEGATAPVGQEVTEPTANARGPIEAPSASAPFAKSASRADLVRYAAATGDFNEIHWDHDAAVAAGLPGVVVHGLLMANWLFQAVATRGVGETPIKTVKVRFKAPVRPAERAVVSSEVTNDGKVSATLTIDGVARATASAEVTR